MTTAHASAPEQTIKLADTANMLHRLAEIEIRYHGEYFCMVDGKRTRIIR